VFLCNWEGDGIRLCGDWRASTDSYTPRFRTYKIALPDYRPKQKPRRGGGLRQINTCCQIPVQVNFSEKTTSRVWCLYSYLVHDLYCIVDCTVLSGRGSRCRGRRRVTTGGAGSETRQTPGGGLASPSPSTGADQ
jgi:hypothetical protein